MSPVIGVGLLPAGGGTKELAIKSILKSEQYQTDVSPFIFKHFQNIAMGKVSLSADELFGMDYLTDQDSVSMNLDYLISDAKKRVISLASNYRPSKPLTEIKAPGRSVAASIKSQLWNHYQNNFVTEFELFMAGIIADVICGGDVPSGTIITEDFLLQLEREAFLKLCGRKETAQRIQHMLKKGKPLRN